MRHEPDRDVSPDDEVQDPPFKPLTREEAQALTDRYPRLSPWKVIAVQSAIGLLVAVLGYVLTAELRVMWSALYGAAAVVVPGALFARGLVRQANRANPSAAVFGFMLWEIVKIVLTVAMLVAAARVVPDLSWPALLVAMVVCMKVNWLAPLWWGRVKNNVARDNR